MSARLHAVSLVVPDYDEAIAFFTGPLDFDLIADDDLGQGKRWVMVCPKAGGTSLLLARAVNDDQRAAIGNQTGGRVGFFLHSGNFAKDHARMTAAGVTFEEQPRSEPYGEVAVFRDPWGNRWDLLQLS